jgi:large subunit ribosomal protein L5
MTTKDKTLNPLREVIIDKVTVNIGIGEAGEELEKGVQILKLLTKKNPVKTNCKVKLPTWGIRPGLAIGTKVVLRGKDAHDFLIWTLKAKENKLPKKCFSKQGNFSYGVHEYLDLQGIKYDPNLGIRGFDVCVNLKRKGYRVKIRKYNKNKIGKTHLVTKEDAIDFAKEKLKIVVE